jgi:hypothetical protein
MFTVLLVDAPLDIIDVSLGIVECAAVDADLACIGKDHHARNRQLRHTKGFLRLETLGMTYFSGNRSQGTRLSKLPKLRTSRVLDANPDRDHGIPVQTTFIRFSRFFDGRRVL